MHTRSLGTLVALAATVAAGCGVSTKKNGKVEINSVSPDASSITGGVEVQISGKGFDDGSAPTVVFGLAEAQVTSFSDQQMAVILPGGSGCGKVDIQVNNSKGFAIEENAFTYTGGNSPLTVTQITPTLGGVAGGTPITIDGSGFTGGAGVLLNGMPLEQITVVSDTQITAVTPSVATGGVADLQVRNCSDEVTLPQAFMFTSGLNGLYVELPLIDLVQEGHFAAGAQDYIDPFLAFVDPTTESLLNPIPTLDTCVFNGSNPAGSFTIVDAGSEVTLTSGSQNIQLTLQSDDLYYFPQNDATAYDTALFLFNGSYSVSASGGAVPQFDAANAFVTPADFTVSEPNLNGSNATTPATVAKSQMQWTWNATQPGDLFEIILVGYDNMGNATNEVLDCYVVDDGSYQIASADVQKLANATQIVVSAVRRKDTDFIVPANGSNAVGVGLLYKRGVLCFPAANCI